MNRLLRIFMIGAIITFSYAAFAKEYKITGNYKLDTDLFSETKDTITERLYDPYSAVVTIRHIEKTPGQWGVIASEVNGKNRLGAFTGNKPFMAGFERINNKYKVVLMEIIDDFNYDHLYKNVLSKKK